MFQNPLSESEVPNNLLQFQTPITCDRFHEISNEELILVNDENTQHTFIIIILPIHIFMLLESLVVKIIPNHIKLYLLDNILQK